MKKNKTRIFIQPLLGVKKSIIVTDSYVGSWISRDYNTMMLVYNANFEPESALANISGFIEKTAWNNLPSYKFDISNWKEDVDLFMSGKYSKFSDKAKTLILEYSGSSEDRTTLHNILYPTAELREKFAIFFAEEMPPGCELYSIPLAEEEFYE